MADKKISELTNYTAPIGTDELPIVDVTAGATKKVTKENLTKEVNIMAIAYSVAL